MGIISAASTDNDVLEAIGEADEAARRSGAAAMIVDDFGALVAREDGAQLHAQLNLRCVNGSSARDIGALVCTSPLDVFSSSLLQTSPLLDSINVTLSPPTLSLAEVKEALMRGGASDGQASSIVARAGTCLPLVKAMQAGAASPSQEEHTAMRLASGLTPELSHRVHNLALRAGRTLPQIDLDGRLAPVVHQTESNEVGLCPFLHDLRVSELLVGTRASWPEDRQSALRWFAARIIDQSDVLWVDRYIGKDLVDLCGFVAELADMVTSCRLRILGSRLPVKNLQADALSTSRALLARARASGLSVEWRLMTGSHVQLLHQRQLAFRRTSYGFSVPPSDRVICEAGAGNEVDAFLPRLDHQLLAAAWDAATPWELCAIS
ncbi:MAG: hypothetical protein U0237_09930 [Thermoleophilia bacterium]